MSRGYSTPELAAIADVPQRFCKVLASVQHGALATVHLQENEAPNFHYYLGIFARIEDEWHEVAHSGSFDLGSEELWASMPSEFVDKGEEATGIGVYCCPAPEGSLSVKVAWRHLIEELPVQNGCFLAVNWEVRSDDWEPPDVVAFLDSEARPTTSS